MFNISNQLRVINTTCNELNNKRNTISHNISNKQNNKDENALLYERKIYTIAWFYKDELENLSKLNKHNIIEILIERFSDINFETIGEYDHTNEESTKTIFPEIKKHINILKDINRYINLINILNKLLVENADQTHIDFYKYITNNYIEYFKYIDTKIEF